MPRVVVVMAMRVSCVPCCPVSLAQPGVLMPILTEYARFVAPGPTHCHGMLRAACHVLCMLPVPIVSSGFVSALDP